MFCFVFALCESVGGSRIGATATDVHHYPKGFQEGKLKMELELVMVMVMVILHHGVKTAVQCRCQAAAEIAFVASAPVEGR